ncbi:putative oleosin 1-like [Sesbania bispinosa]|nr:putative oleosin 1-like [Sesbania bispinosa]
MLKNITGNITTAVSKTASTVFSSDHNSLKQLDASEIVSDSTSNIISLSDTLLETAANTISSSDPISNNNVLSPLTTITNSLNPLKQLVNNSTTFIKTTLNTPLQLIGKLQELVPNILWLFLRPFLIIIMLILFVPFIIVTGPIWGLIIVTVATLLWAYRYYKQRNPDNQQ